VLGKREARTLRAPGPERDSTRHLTAGQINKRKCELLSSLPALSFQLSPSDVPPSSHHHSFSTSPITSVALYHPTTSLPVTSRTLGSLTPSTERHSFPSVSLLICPPSQTVTYALLLTLSIPGMEVPLSVRLFFHRPISPGRATVFFGDVGPRANRTFSSTCACASLLTRHLDPVGQSHPPSSFDVLQRIHAKSSRD
jgi:hypothetical protein